MLTDIMFMFLPLILCVLGADTGSWDGRKLSSCSITRT